MSGRRFIGRVIFLNIARSSRKISQVGMRLRCTIERLHHAVISGALVRNVAVGLIRGVQIVMNGVYVRFDARTESKYGSNVETSLRTSSRSSLGSKVQVASMYALTLAHFVRITICLGVSPHGCV